jgi:hypothetical protein
MNGMNDYILTQDERIRIFISSTIKELKQERMALKDAIRNELRLSAILFEESANPYYPRDKYRAWLERSDIYIGIFWESYGYVDIDSKMTVSGIEDEYMLAKKIQIPKLVYIKNTTKGRDPRLETLIEKISHDKVSYKTFEDVDELVNSVKDDIAHFVTERFRNFGTYQTKSKIDYLMKVKHDIVAHGFVERPIIMEQIENALCTEDKILLLGEPGSGKTFLLGKMGIDSNAIYISLRDKDQLEVFSCITNGLRATQNMASLRFNSREEAKFELESTLQNSKSMILIDDADQDISLSRLFAGMDYYGNKVIIASRKETILGGSAIQTIHVESLNQDEIREYLREKNIELDHGKFIELVRACSGSPLYLYYFANFQLEPLPSGLMAYQQALWRTLNSKQRQILGLTAISLFPPRIDTLYEALKKLNRNDIADMDIVSIIEELPSVIKINEGSLEIFHTYFKEFISKEIGILGITNEYHRLLGEIHLNIDNIVEATYHFVKAKDNRCEDHLLQASHYAHMSGLLELSEEFLCKQIEVAKLKGDNWIEGNAHYHLGLIFHEKGLFGKSNEQFYNSIELFRSCENQEWTKFALIQYLLNQIALGDKTSEVIELLEQELDAYRDIYPIGEAYLLVNLSWAYLQISNYIKAANTAKRAYELFAEENNHEGMIVSLINLAGSLGQTTQQDLAAEYALKIIENSEIYRRPRMKAAGLNILALTLRRNKKPIEARKCLEMAVDIC